MSLAVTATVAAVTAVAYNGYQANKANQQARSAQRDSLASAKKQADLADQAVNKANAKTPDLGAMLLGNTGRGAGSTTLTGPGGVDTSQLLLGRNTLLGG